MLPLSIKVTGEMLRRGRLNKEQIEDLARSIAELAESEDGWKVGMTYRSEVVQEDRVYPITVFHKQDVYIVKVDAKPRLRIFVPS